MEPVLNRKSLLFEDELEVFTAGPTGPLGLAGRGDGRSLAFIGQLVQPLNERVGILHTCSLLWCVGCFLQ